MQVQLLADSSSACIQAGQHQTIELSNLLQRLRLPSKERRWLMRAAMSRGLRFWCMILVLESMFKTSDQGTRLETFHALAGHAQAHLCNRHRC